MYSSPNFELLHKLQILSSLAIISILFKLIYQSYLTISDEEQFSGIYWFIQNSEKT